MPIVDIVVIAVVATALALVLAGYLWTRRRERHRAADRERAIREADRALEQARAADRGWDRHKLEQATRAAIAEARPEFSYHALELVLVDDRPGTDEDRAQMLARGPDGELSVVLARRGDRWSPERVD